MAPAFSLVPRECVHLELDKSFFETETDVENRDCHIELPITTGSEITVTIGRYEWQIVIVIVNYKNLTYTPNVQLLTQYCTHGQWDFPPRGYVCTRKFENKRFLWAGGRWEEDGRRVGGYEKWHGSYTGKFSHFFL